MSYDDPVEPEGIFDGAPAGRPAQGRGSRGGSTRGRSARSQTPPISDDYIEVKDRVVEFYSLFPQGRIETQIVDMDFTVDTRVEERTRDNGSKYSKTIPFATGRVVVRAAVYRDSDPATKPAGEGSSFMLMPGTTPYTEASELENAETSAVGRALAMAGISAHKGLSSGNEIRSKQTDAGSSTETRGRPQVTKTAADTAPMGPVSEKATPDAPEQRGAVVDAATGEMTDTLSAHAFMSWLRESLIPQALAAHEAKSLWPEAKSLRNLDDEQRWLLREKIIDTVAKAALMQAGGAPPEKAATEAVGQIGLDEIMGRTKGGDDAE